MITIAVVGVVVSLFVAGTVVAREYIERRALAIEAQIRAIEASGEASRQLVQTILQRMRDDAGGPKRLAPTYRDPAERPCPHCGRTPEGHR